MHWWLVPIGIYIYVTISTAWYHFRDDLWFDDNQPRDEPDIGAAIWSFLLTLILSPYAILVRMSDFVNRLDPQIKKKLTPRPPRHKRAKLRDHQIARAEEEAGIAKDPL